VIELASIGGHRLTLTVPAFRTCDDGFQDHRDSCFGCTLLFAHGVVFGKPSQVFFGEETTAPTEPALSDRRDNISSAVVKLTNVPTPIDIRSLGSSPDDRS
jgi:hypothetical protein